MKILFTTKQILAFLQFLYIWAYVVCRRIGRKIYWALYPEKLPISNSVQISEFASSELNKFLQFKVKVANPNTGIDSIFYSAELHKTLSIDHPIDKLYKSRVLMASVPVFGNVIMCYDPVKLTFSYYSDFYVSSYEILNAVAMKYCRQFFCLDFFVDETIDKSPLLEILKDTFYADNILASRITCDNGGGKLDPDLEYIKQNSHLFKINSSSTNTVSAESMTSEKYKNRFSYLGRIRDFKPLQSLPIKPQLIQNILFPEKIESFNGGDSIFDKRDLNFNWNTFKANCKKNLE